MKVASPTEALVCTICRYCWWSWAQSLPGKLWNYCGRDLQCVSARWSTLEHSRRQPDSAPLPFCCFPYSKRNGEPLLMCYCITPAPHVQHSPSSTPDMHGSTACLVTAVVCHLGHDYGCCFALNMVNVMWIFRDCFQVCDI